MPIADLVIILVTLGSVVLGWFRGLVREAFAIVALLGAIYAALHLGPYAGGWLGGTIGSTELQLWAGRFLVFIIILALGAIAGWGISKIVHLSGLSGTDRALGGAFGLLRSALFVGVFVLGGRYTGFDSNLWWHESKIIPYAEHIADWIIIMVPQGLEMLDPDSLPEGFRIQITAGV